MELLLAHTGKCNHVLDGERVAMEFPVTRYSVLVTPLLLTSTNKQLGRMSGLQKAAALLFVIYFLKLYLKL